MQIKAVIDSSIHFESTQLSPDILQSLLDRLRVPNPAKKIAEREMLYDANRIPSHLELWKWNGHGELVFPRGFVWEMEHILKEQDIQIQWNNHIPKLPWYDHTDIVPELRPYQKKAISKLWSYNGGIYKSPTGSGKTRVMLELIRMIRHKTIIFCEKSDISTQWLTFAEGLGFRYENIGLIGDGKWEDDKELVIALRQSVYSANLDQEWFNQWGMVVVDECHHCSADTMFELVQRFPAYFRYGCSATPDSDPEIFPIARAVLGPVMHNTTPDEIGEHLIKPSVKVIPTDFSYPYRPTFREGRKIIRNNYNDMMDALEIDFTRNSLIMRLAEQEAVEGHQCLIISKRKNHLRAIYEHWSSDYLLHFHLTGDNSKDYKEIIEQIDRAECGSILFSTLADEGTDIPRLDRLFLTYPGRKIRGYEQSIGRIMRPHPKKKDAIVYDFRDVNVSLLNSQYRDRAQRIYAKKDYKVEMIDG